MWWQFSSSTCFTSTTLGRVLDFQLEFWLEDLDDIAGKENVEDEHQDGRNCKEDDAITWIHPTQFILILETVDDIREDDEGGHDPAKNAREDQ